MKMATIFKLIFVGRKKKEAENMNGAAAAAELANSMIGLTEY